MFEPNPIAIIRRFFSALPRLLPVVLFLACVPGLLLADLAQAADGDVVVGHIDGTITPVMANYVKRVIQQAEDEHAPAVVFEMDTPGGLSSAMDDIVRDILESNVPVVVYVSPRGARAASAGVYITYAAHVAAMAPGTNIGSASPIFEGGDDSTNVNDVTLNKKVTNDAVAQIKNLAYLRGRNIEWGEQAVREAVNVTADEALSLGVIDLIAPDLPTLLTDINGKTVQLESGPVTLATADKPTEDADMNIAEQFLQLLADPTIAYLLISFGMLAIYLELSHPGLTAPGVIGVISVLLGFFALGNIPVNWTGILLIGLSFILFTIDLFVTSFGTLTIGGLVAFVVGSYMLVGNTVPGYHLAHAAIWAMAFCLVAFSLLLGAAVMRAKRKPVATGVNRLVGQVGVVRTQIEPKGSGMVAINGELWNAKLVSGATTTAFVGEQVVAAKISGLTMIVRPATEQELANLPGQPEGDPRFVVPITKVTAGGTTA